MSACCDTGFLKIIKSVSRNDKIEKLKTFAPPKKSNS